MDKLRLIKLFLAVVDEQSFAAAAHKLGVSPSTISKAVARLEQNTGVQLFQRNTRQLKVTRWGEKYAVTARIVTEQLEECESNMQQANDQPRGVLRLSVPVSYGRLYIRPMLKLFCTLYPEITIDISYDDKHIDIINSGIDVCIRSGTVEDSQTIVRQLSPIDFIICASPDYLKNNGAPKTAQEFHKHHWIRFRFLQTGKLMPIIMPNDEKKDNNPDQTFIVDDGEALAELCADGLGLTQMPHFIARKWLQRKLVTPLFPTYTPLDQGVYLMYPKKVYQSARVKAFTDFVCKQVESMGETPRQTWAKNLKIWQP